MERWTGYWESLTSVWEKQFERSSWRFQYSTFLWVISQMHGICSGNERREIGRDSNGTSQRAPLLGNFRAGSEKCNYQAVTRRNENFPAASAWFLAGSIKPIPRFTYVVKKKRLKNYTRAELRFPFTRNSKNTQWWQRVFRQWNQCLSDLCKNLNKDRKLVFVRLKRIVVVSTGNGSRLTCTFPKNIPSVHRMLQQFERIYSTNTCSTNIALTNISTRVSSNILNAGDFVDRKWTTLVAQFPNVKSYSRKGVEEGRVSKRNPEFRGGICENLLLPPLSASPPAKHRANACTSYFNQPEVFLLAVLLENFARVYAEIT